MYTIFGSTGFIGSEIIKNLKKKKIKVHKPKKNVLKFKKNLGHVIYCVGSDDWKDKPKKGYFSNFGHLQQIVYNNNFKSFIFLSTTRLYLNSSKTVSEKNNILIKTDDINYYYNILKAASESLLLSLNKNIIILRLSNVFGNNFNSPLLLPTLIRNAIQKSKINISINVNSTKDYISINDVIDLIFKIQKKNRFKIYNIASGENITLKKIIQIIRNKTNCRVFTKNQNIKVKEPVISINRIQKEYNFKSSLNLEKDLPSLIANFKKRLK